MRFVGYPVVFGVTADIGGMFFERVAPGALDRTLREHPDIRLLWAHDPAHPLARVKSGTLNLTADSHGLRAQADLADTQAGRDVAELLTRGDVGGMSFGFSEPVYKWSTHPSGRDLGTLVDLNLLEVSIVTWPAYEATTAGLDDDKARWTAAKGRHDRIAATAAEQREAHHRWADAKQRQLDRLKEPR
ncbi:MAG: HK97 family phage prohead protease [Acidimicrobiia bacterium]